MQSLINKITLVFRDRILRLRVLVTLMFLIIFRFLAVVPIPGVDYDKLEKLFASSPFLGLLNVFSGGGLSTLSIVMLGVGPYITSSIIMQLLTILSPSLKAMYQEEGDAGRKKFNQYSRMMTIPLAVIQGFSFLVLLQRQGVISSFSMFETITNVIVIATGSILLMWIGELITEYGIGNGLSLIIFAGIVSALPQTVSQLIFTFDTSMAPLYLLFLALSVVIIWAVVFITEAERPIPITYAKRIRGSKVYGGVSTYLPLRVNQAGVIPIIFALSLLLFPQMIFGYLSGIDNSIIASISKIALGILTNNWVYSILYFILVFSFTYFYTAVTFDPNSVAENLQKSGAFIPGVRPGKSTAEYVSKILTRLTLVGALFLGLIAVLPVIMMAVTGINSLSIGGTGLLIVVSVVIELIRQISSQISMREY